MNQFSVPDSIVDSVESLRMTNTSTQIFFELLILSGSQTATIDREKEFIIWLAQHDQNCVGRGNVGFNMDEMPWAEEDFYPMKQFMLKTVEGAIHKTGWTVLDYEPSVKWSNITFQHFYQMIESFEQKHVNSQNYLEWITPYEGDEVPTIPEGYPMCNQHSVYLSCFGCIICNSL